MKLDKLHGWHRLWILLSIVYFVLVASYVILNFPKAENISHQSEFYKKLSTKSAGMIYPATIDDALALGGKIVQETELQNAQRAGGKKNINTELQLPAGFILDKPQSSIKKDIFDEIQPSIDFHPIMEMPNKHTIEFNAKLSEENMKIASEEYWRVVKQKTTEKRLHLLFYAFLCWVVPCLSLYALGWSIGWIYEGFKQKDVQQ